jgi:phosphatidate cytidylyltransferase
MPISRELKLRTISALILAPLVLLPIVLGGVGFYVLMGIATVVASFEWNNIVSHGAQRQMSIQERTRWDIGGMVYIALPMVSLLVLRSTEYGLQAFLWLVVVVWTTDIAAYAAGRTIGGPKLIPSISPKKTWAGLIGAVLAAGIAGAIFGIYLGTGHVLSFTIMSASLAVVAQAGDFFESWVKRYFGVKDSGATIPGHGGLLDRVDGIMAVAPVMLVIVLLAGKGMFGIGN